MNARSSSAIARVSLVYRSRGEREQAAKMTRPISDERSIDRRSIVTADPCAAGGWGRGVAQGRMRLVGVATLFSRGR
jgi:hypothetical protein